jgi:hypothetical protein
MYVVCYLCLSEREHKHYFCLLVFIINNSVWETVKRSPLHLSVTRLQPDLFISRLVKAVIHPVLITLRYSMSVTLKLMNE